MSEESTTLEAYLADHPRMIGVLFMLLLVLVQAGTVAAGSSANAGP